MDLSVIQPVVAGAVSGLGVVAIGLRSHFRKIEKIDAQELRIATLETKVIAVESYGSKMDLLTATISQVASDLAFLKGRLIQHDEWERDSKYPPSARPRTKR